MNSKVIKPAGKHPVEVLFDSIGFKSKKEARKAFGGMTPTEYFRKIREDHSRKKTF